MKKVVKNGISLTNALNFIEKSDWEIDEIRQKKSEPNITYYYKQNKKVGCYNGNEHSLYKFI